MKLERYISRYKWLKVRIIITIRIININQITYLGWAAVENDLSFDAPFEGVDEEVMW